VIIVSSQFVVGTVVSSILTVPTLNVALIVVGTFLMLLGVLLIVAAANVVTQPTARRMRQRLGREGLRALVVPGVLAFIVGLALFLPPLLR